MGRPTGRLLALQLLGVKTREAAPAHVFTPWTRHYRVWYCPHATGHCSTVWMSGAPLPAPSVHRRQDPHRGRAVLFMPFGRPVAGERVHKSYCHTIGRGLKASTELNPPDWHPDIASRFVFLLCYAPAAGYRLPCAARLALWMRERGLVIVPESLCAPR